MFSNCFLKFLRTRANWEKRNCPISIMPESWLIISLINYFINYLLPLLSDLLRGVQTFPEELHPPVHGHQELLSLRAMESLAESLRCNGHKSVLWLHRDGHDSSQLHIPSDDRDGRGSRVSIWECTNYCSFDLIPFVTSTNGTRLINSWTRRKLSPSIKLESSRS